MEQAAKPAAESSLANENADSEAKKGGETDTVQRDEGGKHPSSAVGRIEECLTLTALHWRCLSTRLIIIIFDVY